MKIAKATAATLMLVAVAVNAGSVADEIKAVKDEIASNSVNRTVKCALYKAWFVDQCTEAEREALIERNIAAHRRWIELEPKSAAPRTELGITFATLGRWKEAKAEFEKVVADFGPYDRTRALWELANCLWQEGDKDRAKKLLSEFVKTSSSWPSQFGWLTSRAKYLDMMLNDSDADLDMLTLPHSVDGKPFPTPQEAKYGDKRISLAKVELKVRGMRDARDEGSHASSDPHVSQDPIIRFLKRKLTRFGTKFEKGGTPIEIELSPDAPVDKPQGYSLDVANGKVAVKARSRLGALWGVVSLIQCVDRRDEKDGSDGRDGPSICEMTIRDWPKCLRRGVNCYWYPEIMELALFMKMSTLNVYMDPEFVVSPLQRERYRIWGGRFAEFGIEMYATSRYMCMEPLLPLTSPRTRKLHYSLAEFMASCGMHHSFHFDDSRFPLHPMDLAAKGSAANLDADYLTEMYRTVKKRYPSHRMQFCPPFYWGPNGGVSYPEPRDEYLKSLGERLDPEIDVHWTGPYVKSGGIHPESAGWYAGLIGRKPTIFHNGDGIGAHNYMHYGADPTKFDKSHSRKIFDFIECFLLNTSTLTESVPVGSCMDWCWNPTAHDGASGVRRTVEMLEGPGVYEILLDATPLFAPFDKYEYDRPRIELLNEDLSDLDRRIAAADEAWRKAVAIAKNGGVSVCGFEKFGLRFARRLANARRNPPEWLVKQREATMANSDLAVKETGFDAAAGDWFFPAEVLSGGRYVPGQRGRLGSGKINLKYVFQGKELSGTFDIEPFPPEKPFKLILLGRAFNNRWPPEVEISVNGRVLYRGVPYPNTTMKSLEVEIPVDALRRNSTFLVRNVSPDVHHAYTLEANYVVVRRNCEKGAGGKRKETR